MINYIPIGNSIARKTSETCGHESTYYYFIRKAQSNFEQRLDSAEKHSCQLIKMKMKYEGINFKIND